MRGNAPLSTLEGITSTWVHHSSRSSSSTTRRNHCHYHHHHHHHHHRHSKRGEYHIHKELNKARTPKFNGEIKKSEDVEAWFLGIEKLFRIDDYSKNMKLMVGTYSLKGKEKIWWKI